MNDQLNVDQCKRAIIMQQYIATITDLFCGELNYSEVTTILINANCERGATNKIGRYTGLKFNHQYGDANMDQSVYYSTSKLTAYTLELTDEYNLMNLGDNVTTI